MPKKEEDYTISETGNWNVASDYSKIKIMRPLFLADEYTNICLFGFSSLIEELQTPIPIDVLKLKGLKRLIHCLILLIDNSIFAVKRGKDDLVKYKKQLKNILPLIEKTYSEKSSQVKRTKEIKINEKYNHVLEAVLEIKALINEPLNKNHLIFTDKEEFDPKAYKQNIKERMINQG